MDAPEREIRLRVAGALVERALEVRARLIAVADAVLRIAETAADLAAVAEPERLVEADDRLPEALGADVGERRVDERGLEIRAVEVVRGLESARLAQQLDRAREITRSASEIGAASGSASPDAAIDSATTPSCSAAPSIASPPVARSGSAIGAATGRRGWPPPTP